MKKHIPAIFVLCLVISCKKDRTCNCTTTVNGGAPANSSFVIKHVTKNQALARSCVNTTTQKTDSLGTTVTVITCKLAK